MRRLLVPLLLGCSLGMTALVVARQELAAALPAAVQPDSASLKELVIAMSYAPAELSENKFEVKVSQDSWDVPIAFEVSSSGRYVWLTAFLGEVPEGGLSAERGNALLRMNHDLQPGHFYVTSNGKLMFGLALENRALDAAMLRRGIEKVAADVAGSSDAWSE